MAYKLKLPEGTKIHHVCHVSCLKKKLGDYVFPSLVLPQVTQDGLANQTPITILYRRMYKKGNAVGVQLLVQ